MFKYCWIALCLAAASSPPAYSAAVSDWWYVRFDEQTVTHGVNPPKKSNRTGWEQQFLWKDIIRVCYLTEESPVSDGIYVFTSTRKESYVIPIEAKGGTEFWRAIVGRKLSSSDIAQIARSLPVGTLKCTPPE